MVELTVVNKKFSIHLIIVSSKSIQLVSHKKGSLFQTTLGSSSRLFHRNWIFYWSLFHRWFNSELASSLLIWLLLLFSSCGHMWCDWSRFTLALKFWIPTCFVRFLLMEARVAVDSKLFFCTLRSWKELHAVFSCNSCFQEAKEAMLEIKTQARVWSGLYRFTLVKPYVT